MKKNALIKLIHEHANTINQLKKKAEQATTESLKKEVWDTFHTTHAALSFPGGFDHALTLLKKNDPKMIDTAIIYLEADPFFFRSGYIKQQLLQELKKLTLTEDQIKHMQEVLLLALNHRRRKDYALLARKLANKEFCEQLELVARTNEDENVRTHAQQMLDCIRS